MKQLIRSRRGGMLWLGVALATLMTSHAMARTQSQPPVRVTLVGASIGKDWHFDGIGERLKLSGYAFEYIGKNSFDKSPLIDDLLNRSDKPDAVLIKECSTYFPGDEARYRDAVIRWVGRLRRAGIEPVLVTTAPVAEPSATLARAKNWVKRVIGKPTWLDSITRYNDWLKAYASEQGLAVFDLEAAVRRSERERWLKSEYDSGDTVHLNQAGYEAVDRAFAEFLESWNRKIARR